MKRRTTKDHPHGLVFYGRISRRPDETREHSIDAQEAACRKAAAVRGLYIERVFSDAYQSGSTTAHRPNLVLAVDACRKGSSLIVYSLSRLARSTQDAIQIAEVLEKKGAGLISATETIDTTTPTGKLFFTFLSALAQFERELTAERTSAAMQYYMAQGRAMGGVAPFGMRITKGKDPDGAPQMRLEEDPEEQETLAKIIELRAQGFSLHAIRHRLDQEGRLQRNGNRWNYETLRKVVNRNVV